MPNLISNTIEKLLFSPVSVTCSERLGDKFQLVSMTGEGLRGVSWIPGQTSQFLVGSLTKRAYTPMDVDAQAGAARFLFYQHDQGPGSAWAASLQLGTVCKLMRPKNSIDFTQDDSPALFFGDETSFAAAQALQQCRPLRNSCHLMFEVASFEDAGAVVSKLGLEQVTLLQKKRDGTHLEQAKEELSRLASLLAQPDWFFTGCAPSIQTLRKRLKAEGFSLTQGAVKPYWAPGKKGLD